LVLFVQPSPQIIGNDAIEPCGPTRFRAIGARVEPRRQVQERGDRAGATRRAAVRDMLAAIVIPTKDLLPVGAIEGGHLAPLSIIARMSLAIIWSRRAFASAWLIGALATVPLVKTAYRVRLSADDAR